MQRYECSIFGPVVHSRGPRGRGRGPSWSWSADHVVVRVVRGRGPRTGTGPRSSMQSPVGETILKRKDQPIKNS